MDKKKRVLQIADELDELASQYQDGSLKEAAAALRKSVTSGKANLNESTENNEGDGDDTGGSNPGGKPKPDKP